MATKRKKPKKAKSSGGKWHWYCDRHSTNFGAYHPDYEACGARSRRGFKIEANCRKAAAAHDRKCWMNKPWDNRVGGQVYVSQVIVPRKKRTTISIIATSRKRKNKKTKRSYYKGFKIKRGKKRRRKKSKRAKAKKLFMLP